ncbi:MAG: cation diffusion facilitator family transporter [Candidatus Bathyarchaeia archaeon]|jgi:cation diffusion facilitator family transporter
MNEKNQLFRKGERAAILSAAVLLAFSILKGTVSIISGSVALLADSIHSFADIFSSIAVWAGLKLVQKKPTERFPYGYYKAETLALLIVAVTIVVSGVLILKEAVDKLFVRSVVLFPSVVLAVAAFSGLVSYFLGRYKKSVGSLIGSQSLISEGQHSLVDVYTALMVFVGVLFASLGYPVSEVLAGLAIGLYVMKVGLWFGKDAVLVLMDACLSPQKAREMKEIAEKVRGVSGVHDLRLHRSGPVSFGEMHIEVEEALPLEKAHEISDEIEEKIRGRFKDIESITIHVEPAYKQKVKVGIPVVEDKGLESKTSAHFGNVPFFAFIELENRQIRNVYVKVNKAARTERKKGIGAARFLVDEKVDVVLAGGMGEGPFHLLRDNLVQIFVLPEQVELKEAIRLLNENKLERMTAPFEKNETDDR